MQKAKDRAQEILCRLIIAAWVMAVRNPRMTAAGVVFALAFLGIDLDPVTQKRLGAGVILFLGLVAGDVLNRRPKADK